MNDSDMKPLLKTASFLAVVLLASSLSASDAPVAAQPSTAQTAPSRAVLTTFDLDFPGGTPRELIAAIEKAQHRPLNAIVPNEYDNWKLPSLKMTHVTVADLFAALEKMAISTVYSMPNGGASTGMVAVSFRTNDRPPTDDSIWYFEYNGTPIRDTTVTRYYRLAPYLDTGLTVDDITTAIQTGWKMSGLTTIPKLSYHKETKLLIAVGDWSAVGNIDNVLHALDPIPAAKATAAPDKPEKPEKKS